MIKKAKILIPTTLGLIISLIAGCGPTTSEPTTNPSVEDTTTSVNEGTSSTDDTTTSIDVSKPSASETAPSTSENIGTTEEGNYPPDYDIEEQNALDEFNKKYSMYDFFGVQNFIKIKIDMDKNELYSLSQDYDAYPHHSSPIYHPCSITFSINDDSIALKKVGLRLKGNTSRRKFVSEDGYIYNTVHFKIDFTEVFDQISYSEEEENRIDDRTFLGLKKIDIKWNKNYDTSHIKEYVASTIYREYGVKSQNMGFAQVVLNNVNMGLYISYETIDKQFIKRHYSKAQNGGDLYKVCYTATGPADFKSAEVGKNVGEEDENANNKNGFFPSYDIKTNKDETDHSSLLNMIKVLNNSNSKIDDIENVIDLNQFIKYEAVSYVLGDPDDLRNNFNNSYLYFNKETGLAEILPYDKDRMFGTTVDWNPTGNGMISANPLSNWAQGAQIEQSNPLYRKILSRPIDGASTYIDTYMKLIKTIFEESENLDNFETTYNTVKDLYKDIIKTDNDLPYCNFSLKDDRNLSMESYITQKYDHFINKYNEYYKL